MLKFIVVGNSNAGKTQLINRFVKDDFNEEFQTTIGCDL
jgi:GTPase SAR1 family protein